MAEQFEITDIVTDYRAGLDREDVDPVLILTLENSLAGKYVI